MPLSLPTEDCLAIVALQYASEELKGDRDFMLDVVPVNVRALQFASEELRGDRSFMLEALSRA